MVVILVIFAMLEFIGGFGVFAGSKSAIHEILGTLAIGFFGYDVGPCRYTDRAAAKPKVA
jgi:hypothetical protein